MEEEEKEYEGLNYNNDLPGIRFFKFHGPFFFVKAGSRLPGTPLELVVQCIVDRIIDDPVGCRICEQEGILAPPAHHQEPDDPSHIICKPSSVYG
jgi:hypothetical protein